MNEIEKETAVPGGGESSDGEEEKEFGDVVQRPKTAYFQFMDDNKDKVKSLNITERAKALGQLWKELPEEQKNAYK